MMIMVEKKKKKKKDEGDESDEDMEEMDREMGDLDFQNSTVIDERMWNSEDENDEDGKDGRDDRDGDGDDDQNGSGRDLKSKDKYSRMEARTDNDKTGEMDENNDNRDGDISATDDNGGNGDEQKEQQLEQQTAKLEYADELSDLDGDVSDENALMEADNEDAKNPNNENGENGDFERDLSIPEHLQIDGISEESDYEDGGGEEEEKKKKGEGNSKNELKDWEDDIKEADKARETENKEDLSRGANEIMPNPVGEGDDGEEWKDDNGRMSDFLDTSDDNEEEPFDMDLANSNKTQETLGSDASDTEMKDDDGGDGGDGGDNEDRMQSNGDHPDVLNPDIINEEEKEEKEENGDKEGTHSDHDHDKMEMDGEETGPMDVEQNMFEDHLNNDNELRADDAMGVKGGMGENAPVRHDEDTNTDHIDDLKNSNYEQQVPYPSMADNGEELDADLMKQFMEDQTKSQNAEWKPLSKKNEKNQRERKKNNKKVNENEKEEEKSNPFRSLGDALSQWKQRLNMIEHNDTAEKGAEMNKAKKEEEEEEEEKGGGDDDFDAEAYAHIPEGMDVDNATEALAEARDEDLAQIPDISNVNREEKSENSDDEDSEMKNNDYLSEIEEEEGGEGDTKYDPTQDITAADRSDVKHKNMEKDLNSKKQYRTGDNDDRNDPEQSRMDLLKQLLGEDNVNENESNRFEDDNNWMLHVQDKKEGGEGETKAERDEIEIEPEINEEATAMEIEELRHELDNRMREWHVRSFDDNAEMVECQQMWRKLSMVTSSLSQNLCEQLRSILEPLQTTKLGGDFKTGKRINLKKVIPFIASQFRKDKIWLRRCKPHKRNYQVLICIDDSESMKENHSGRLALEALCILTKALTSLEVGEIGVFGFGKKVSLLHSLNQPFSDDSGAFVISQFSFSQQQTRYHDLIATVVNVLSKSSNSSNSVSDWNRFHSETLSLVFIISDGRVQQDRSELEALVRVAHERKQIVLLIIIDSPKCKEESIVDIQSIHFDPASQQMQVSSYLDAFPFPYYAIISDIDTLPNVVADALRQWFELVRQSS